MKQPIHRRTVLTGGLAFAAALVVPAARACEVYTPSLTIVHPWTRASAPGATTAIVCMTFQDVVQSDRLIGAQTPVAEGAELGGDDNGSFLNFAIHEGQTTVLSEQGVHLRLVGLKVPMQAGRSYPMTLMFAKGGAAHATLSVDFARFG